MLQDVVATFIFDPGTFMIVVYAPLECLSSELHPFSLLMWKTLSKNLCCFSNLNFTVFLFKRDEVPQQTLDSLESNLELTSNKLPQ